MARCLNLTKAGEYAMAALARLVLEPAEPMPISELARRQRLPGSFLSKIVAQGVKAGLLQSRKGPSGGVTLARPAGEISLLDIIEAFEGSYVRQACVFYPSRACEGPRCQVYCPLRRREEDVREGLAATSLAEMAASLRDHPENARAPIREGMDGYRGESGNRRRGA